MEVTTKEYKSSDLITVNGRIDSYSAPQLAETLDGLVSNGHYKIVLDMSAVEFMSSAGLRVMISTQKGCKKHKNGELVLAAVPDRICKALDLAGFTPMFSIFDDTMDAVGHF